MGLLSSYLTADRLPHNHISGESLTRVSAADRKGAGLVGSGRMLG